VGDRVACNPLTGCGQCEVCRSGFTFRCPNRTAAFATFGGFGDYIAFPAHGAVRLPDALSLADGALVEPIACGLHALRQAHWRGDERILVLGAGTMAASVVYWARALGAAKIVVASRSTHAHEMMMTLGADAVHSLQEEDEAALAEKLGGPPDMVAECVGKAGMIGQAIERVRQGGTVISMGMCGHAEPITGMYCGFKEISVTFPVGYTAEAFAETARAFDRGHVKPDLIVGEVIPLEQLPEVFEGLRHRSQSWKVHVDPRLKPADGYSNG
jgi:(R,R)-butanediol dehydrogenase/meso-butanediol dehydrogenase/diacetyl reductase